MSEPMTDEDLATIEGVLDGTDEPETDWWVQTVKRLVAEARRLRADAERLHDIALAEQDRLNGIIRQNAEDWKSLRAENDRLRALARPRSDLSP